MQSEIKVDGLDIVDVINFIDKKKNKFIAIMLGDLELKVPKDSEEYQYMRKLLLDGMNDYTRSVLRIIFGDVEGLVMK